MGYTSTGVSVSKIYFALQQTLCSSENITVGKHSSLFSLPRAPPKGCRAIPCFPLCPSTQMNATVGLGFCSNTNIAKRQYSLFQGHIPSHQVEVLSSSYRNTGYLDGCTTTACMGQRFGTEMQNIYETKLNIRLLTLSR